MCVSYQLRDRGSLLPCRDTRLNIGDVAKIPTKSPSAHAIKLRLPADLVAKIDEEAEKLFQPRNGVIVRAITDFLESRNPSTNG